jgi:hypothetical protein
VLAQTLHMHTMQQLLEAATKLSRLLLHSHKCFVLRTLASMQVPAAASCQLARMCLGWHTDAWAQ